MTQRIQKIVSEINEIKKMVNDYRKRNSKKKLKIKN